MTLLHAPTWLRVTIAASTTLLTLTAADGRRPTAPSISCWSGTDPRSAEPTLTVRFRRAPSSSVRVTLAGARRARAGDGSVQAEAKTAQATAACGGRDVILTVNGIDGDTLDVRFSGFRRVRLKSPTSETSLPAADAASVEGNYRCDVEAKTGGVRCVAASDLR